MPTLAKGAIGSTGSAAGVPSHWINPATADDPVEQFVVRKSTPTEPQPTLPPANDVRPSSDAGVNAGAEAAGNETVGNAAAAGSRATAARPVSRSSVVPRSVLWAGAGVCGVCLFALIGWQWVRYRRRRDVPEVAVLSLAAFRQSSESVPQSASSAVRRRAA